MAQPDRIILAIETSNPASGSGAGPKSGIALGAVDQDGRIEVLGREPVRSGPGAPDDLLPAVARLCEQAGVGPTDLWRVGVSQGPGGFTGLRIAVMTAKLIAEICGADCVGVPTADALRRRVALDEPDQTVHIGLAWKRDTLWVAEYERGLLQPTGAPGLAGFDQTARRAVGGVLVVDRVLEDRLRESGLIDREQLVIPPEFDAVAVLEVACEREPLDPAQLAPIYPRGPEAVRLAEARRSAKR